MNHRALFLLLSLALTNLGCEPSAAPPPAGPTDLRVTLAPPAFGYQIHSQPHVVEPFSELTSCDIVKIMPAEGEKIAWINGLESRTSLHSHHMNVLVGYFSFLDYIAGEGTSENFLGVEAGHYDCAELGDLMEQQNAVPLYPSQRTHQRGRFPEGVALPVVAPMYFIIQHHYINVSEKAVLVDARLNMERVDEEKVKHVVTGFFGGARIELEGNSKKIVANTCALGGDVNLFAFSSHSHERGKCFTANLFDRLDKTIDPEPFFVNDDWESPPILFAEKSEWMGNAPLPMKAGDGVHWACHYENHEDRTVVEGASSKDEMCFMVGIGYPSKISVADIKAMLEKPSVDLLERLKDEILVPCNPVTEATSPWPRINESIPLDSADADFDACQEYPTTSGGSE